MVELQPKDDAVDIHIERKLTELGSHVDEVQSEIESSNSILNNPDISQQLTRRTVDGLDTLMGYFRCQFAAQQTRYALHVPLYPAMNQIPEIEAAIVDGEQAKVRITDRQKFGVRLEIVLPQPPQSDQCLLVEVTAFSPLET